MGNIFRNDAFHCTPVAETPFTSKPDISIPTGDNMNPSAECRIRFRARHAATDYPATIEAHKDHTIAQLKRYLIEQMGMPFPSEDGRCKIMAVYNKPDLLPDQPIKDKLETNDRYLGGSIDHLTLAKYGLGNGDYIMFVVTFPQLQRLSTCV